MLKRGEGGSGGNGEEGGNLTFFPSGIAFKSTSTFAIAKTSAEADMLTRKSGFDPAVTNRTVN
jgi:hypothetical protein